MKPKRTLVTKKMFLQRANKKHNNYYDYSDINYVNTLIKIDITCAKHGKFSQRPSKHMLGRGCPKCAREKTNAALQEKSDECKKNFIARATKAHGDSFTYLSEYVSATEKISILCKSCGTEFKQRVADHIRGTGCPYCRKSRGEVSIRKWLDDNNFAYEQEKWFDDCRGISRPLPFDFWLPDHNMLIEYQGRQHYEPVIFYNGYSMKTARENLEKTQRTDAIKHEYCSRRNINLVTIPFYDLKKVSRILSEITHDSKQIF